jgi:hypothetical protein
MPVDNIMDAPSTVNVSQDSSSKTLCIGDIPGLEDKDDMTGASGCVPCKIPPKLIMSTTDWGMEVNEEELNLVGGW